MLSVTRIVVLLIPVFFTACGGGQSQTLASPPFSVEPQVRVNIPINQAFSIQFNRELDAQSINSYTAGIWQIENDYLIESQLSYDEVARVLTIKPYMPLPYNTRFELYISDQIRYKTSDHIDASHNIEFTTTAAPDVTEFYPANGAQNVNPRSSLRIQLPVKANIATINTSTFRVNRTSNNQIISDVSGSIVTDPILRTAIFKPNTPFSVASQYEYSLTSAIVDKNGSPLFPSGQPIRFTTQSIVGFANLFGTTQDDFGYAIAHIDNQIVIAGETWGSLQSSTQQSGGDGFIAGFNQFNGNRDWFLQIGNANSPDAIYAMTTVGRDIYVTGYTDSFIPGVEAINTYGTTSHRRLFIEKFSIIDVTPIPQWISYFGSSDGLLLGFGIVADANSAYVIAQGTGSLLDAKKIGDYDAYIIKVNGTDGKLETNWPRIFGSNVADYVQAIAMDAQNIYIAGDTLGNISSPDSMHVGNSPFYIVMNKMGTTSGDVYGYINAGDATDVTVVGLTTTGSTTHMLVTARNKDGTYAFVSELINSQNSLAVIGEKTPLIDERGTAIYSINGNVYVAITRFRPGSTMTHGGVPMNMTSTSEIYRLSGNQLTLINAINADMHATIRDMVSDGNNLYLTGWVHGAYNGISPYGLADVFIDKVPN